MKGPKSKKILDIEIAVAKKLRLISNNNIMLTDLKSQIEHNRSTIRNLIEHKKIIAEIIKVLSACLKKGKKFLYCGNGGSAADAQHLSTEFLIRLRPNVNRKSFPVISLAQDVSTVTACGNDLGFENIFSRNLEGLEIKVIFYLLYPHLEILKI